MRRIAGRYLITACVLSGMASILSAQEGVRVWALDDGVRVDPVTGRLLVEARRDVHTDYPTTDEYRRRNPVWDGETGRVRLRAARNEFVAFQVMVETERPLKQVDVRFDRLVHPSGSELSGRLIQVFKEWYVQVRRPSLGYEKTSLGPAWYADALIPKRPEGLFSGFPFSIPDLFNNIPGQRVHGIWVDVFVPRDSAAAPAGTWQGELKVTWEGGSSMLPVELEVWDFALPDETSLPGDIWNNSMRSMSRSDELAWYHLARQHRFLPLIYAYRPELEIRDGKVSLDWTEYDARVGPLLDGSAFTAEYGYWGPGEGLPVHHLMLPFNVDSEKHPGGAWPVPTPPGGRNAEYERIWNQVARSFREHFDARPEWNKVVKVAFLNGLDESYFEDAYREMLYYGKLLHDGLGRDWFWYRIDGGYDRAAMERLQAEVDLWVCHTVAFDLPTVEHFRRQGMEVWFYGPMIYEQRRNSGCGSNTFLDLDLNVNRAIGWVGWKYRTGWVQWEFDWNAYAAWYEAENFKEEGRFYNGSGQLIYRGAVMNIPGPVPSIRLKSTRRGLQDYEYFALLAARFGEQRADELVNSVIYRNPFGKASIGEVEIWKNSPAAWEAVRLAAGTALAGP